VQQKAGLFQKLSSEGGNVFTSPVLHPQDMRKGTNAHPQDKSEYQLPPLHLNILDPQDSPDKKNVAAHPHPPEDNFWNSPDGQPA